MVDFVVCDRTRPINSRTTGKMKKKFSPFLIPQQGSIMTALFQQPKLIMCCNDLRGSSRVKQHFGLRGHLADSSMLTDNRYVGYRLTFDSVRIELCLHEKTTFVVWFDLIWTLMAFNARVQHRNMSNMFFECFLLYSPPKGYEPDERIEFACGFSLPMKTSITTENNLNYTKKKL